MLLGATIESASIALAQLPCVGDCAGDGRVTVDDLVKGVNIALSARPLDDCAGFDTDGDERVAVNELVLGVRSTLEGCMSSVPSPSPTDTVGASPTMTPTASVTASVTAVDTATATATATRVAAARPNVIVINLDDTRADGIDRMPALQEIASQGVVFRNAFVPLSVCAPSRASLLSGRHAHHHGTRGVALQIGGADTFRTNRADQQTIAVWLQAAGYQTGLFGKYINDYSNTEATQGPGGTFYVPPGWTRWRAIVSPEHYGGVHGPSYRIVDEHGGVTLFDDHESDAQYATDLLAREMRTFIGEAIDAEQPFFALWAPYASHVDQPDLVPVPAARHFDTLADILPWRPPSWNEMDRTDKPRWVGALPVTPILAAVTDLARQRAYETLLSVDEQIALIVELLRERGVTDNTAIIVTSDNGVSWGEHGYFGQGKGCVYEECLRVPMMVSYPRVVSNGRVVDAPVLNIDVAPTVAALAGVVVPLPIDGRSFAPWLAGSAVPDWRDDFLLEYWHELRGDSLFFSGQPADGDRVRVLYGDPRVQPRPFATFEFDDGNGTTGDDARPVALDADALATFTNLGITIVSTVAGTSLNVGVVASRVTIGAANGSHLDGRTFIIELDQNRVMRAQDGLPDYVGVRDVARGYTYAEYETGEIELYDLTLDPHQLENKAAEPGFAQLRDELAQRLAALLAQQ